MMPDLDNHSFGLMALGALQFLAGAVGWFIKQRLVSMESAFKDVASDVKSVAGVVGDHKAKIAVLETQVTIHAKQLEHRWANGEDT